MTHNKSRGDDLKNQLAGIIDLDDLEQLNSINGSQRLFLHNIMLAEINRLCAHARPIVPSEPLRENARVGGKDGTNDDSHDDSHVDAHRGHNVCARVAGIQRNLEKLDKGKAFGICDNELCGFPITSRRLFASRFSATHCLECQKEQEKGKERGPGRLKGMK